MSEITDPQALTSPDPRDIRTYLRSTGWKRPTQRISKPDVWQVLRDNYQYEVIAPSFKSNPDYANRVADLLRTLSLVEARDEADVLRDLLSVAYDVQYFRTFHDTPSGTAPVKDVAETYHALHVMLASAAASLESDSAVLSPTDMRRGHNGSGKILAGPTSEGSYVVSVWVPIPPILTPEEDYVLFELADVPPERQITEQLRSALIGLVEASSDAADGRDVLEAFGARLDKGVTANLCEAVAEVAGNTGQPLEVSFAWALGRPIADLAEPIILDARSIDLIRDAAEVLRNSIPEPEVQLIGNVVRLHRDTAVGPGEVTIAGSVLHSYSQERRRVAVSLSEFDYDQAIQAHGTGVDVSVTGLLSRRGNRFRLTGVESLNLIEDYDA